MKPQSIQFISFILKQCYCITLIFFLLYYAAVIFGEDVAFGGVFRCTVGLKDKYGESGQLESYGMCS